MFSLPCTLLPHHQGPSIITKFQLKELQDRLYLRRVLSQRQQEKQNKDTRGNKPLVPTATVDIKPSILARFTFNVAVKVCVYLSYCKVIPHVWLLTKKNYKACENLGKKKHSVRRQTSEPQIGINRVASSN